MLTLLARLFGNLIFGLCLSFFGIFFMTLLLTVKNLPRLLTSLRDLLRSLLRFSFACYAALLGWVRGPIHQVTGIDLLRPVPRAIATTLLSVSIGWAGLSLLSLPLAGWLGVTFALHGLFVGLAWDQITTPDDFQMGDKLG